MMAVEVKDLRKSYNGFEALKGISFHLEKGEIFALLGPNGAGKTTTIRILCGLTRPGGGQAFFFGMDIFKNPLKAKKLAGLVPQALNLDLDLTVWENLLIHGLLFGLSLQEIKEQGQSLMEFSGLRARLHHKVRTLSGGMRRRVLITRALLHRPRILFLDEPTVGLDPHIRRKLWGLIKRIQQQGTTILLTTHYIEEAEFLANRVAFIDNGTLVIVDKPQNLTSRLGKYAVDIVQEDGLETKYFPDRQSAEDFILSRRETGTTVTLRRVNLEDAFVYFTGKRV